jgi:hypothetical protein
MPSVAFEPAIPTIKQLHTYALYCPATGIGIMHLYCFHKPSSLEFCYKVRHTISGAISGSDSGVYASEIRSAPLATHEHNTILFSQRQCFLSAKADIMVFWFITPCSLVGEHRRQEKIWALTRLHGTLSEYAVIWNSLLFRLSVQCAC